MKIMRIARGDRPQLQPRLARLEGQFDYPLGTDSFRLDHGADYFAFFDRLGAVRFHAALDGETLAAVGAGVIRRVPFRRGEPARRAWYLCDLKVDPHYGGRGLPRRLFAHQFIRCYLACPRGYTISMNRANGANPVARLLGRFKQAKLAPNTKLILYSLDENQMRAVEPLLIAHRGPLSYLSLAGKKDLILGSTGRRMPLLHVQFGACAEPGLSAPQPGHVHMFCAPEGDELERACAAAGLAAAASATVLAHGMQSDWRFILTSDI
jgi:hypothetical protein